MKVAIRDDDTCALTTPEGLSRVYEGIWDHVPVSLGIIPFAVGYPRVDVPRERWYVGNPSPFEGNGPLIKFIREHHGKGRFGIILHGYTHEDFPDGFEFQAAPDLKRRVREGRQYLEALLGVRITVFIPPHNALSKRGFDAVSAEGMDILGSFLFFHPSLRPMEWRGAINWWQIKRFRRVTGRRRLEPLVYPHVLRFARHREFGCHSLIPSTTLEELIRGFEEARLFGGDFCIATHHWELDDKMRGILEDLLAHASRYPDVHFVKTEELFR